MAEWLQAESFTLQRLQQVTSAIDSEIFPEFFYCHVLTRNNKA
jgi:hypothetical protein